MCLPISYPEGRKDVGELEKPMYRRCTQEKRPSLSQEWPEVRGMDQVISRRTAVTPHCSYQPDARIIQSGTFLAKQPHEGGKLWSCKVPLHVETSRERKGWLREGMAWRMDSSTSSGHKKKLKGDLMVRQLANPSRTLPRSRSKLEFASGGFTLALLITNRSKKPP
ncbi:hypothetical protein Bca52824_035352 [Brassica carinata]|uniref:Uncharacterized protein n=1 Tax=Brassica carinata TaxID=52824 RepID=A0A8X7S2J0_BRACI|nr:hypothetical protein Bca52824_035352 [Brassica carinata]